MKRKLYCLFFLLCLGCSPKLSADVLWGAHILSVTERLPDGRHRLELAAEMGLEVVRLGVSWANMEPRRGERFQFYWDNLDQILTLAESLNLRVVLIVAETPCWASFDPARYCGDETLTNDVRNATPPSDPEDYADFMRTLVKLYGDRVYAWEVWNEPNIGHFWRGFPPRQFLGFWPSVRPGEPLMTRPDAAFAYTKVLKAAYRAIKGVDKRAIVLAGSTAGSDTYFINAMYQSGAKGNFDGLSLHPYSALMEDGTVDWINECNRPPWCFDKGIKSVRDLMVNVYQDDKPIWFTEFGMSSNSGFGGVSEETQAEYLRQVAERLASLDYVKAAIWFNLVSTDEQNTEGHFGLYHADLSLKPAGTVMQSLARQSPEAASPEVLGPDTNIKNPRPRFYWQAVEGASSYFLWVNEYGGAGGADDTPGAVRQTLSPTQAECDTGGVCSYAPSFDLLLGAAQWWVTVNFPDRASVLSEGLSFSMASAQQDDSDGDGIINRSDNCQYHANPSQRDSDFDGVGNRCDADFNNDAWVNQTDKDYLNSRLGTNDILADLNEDGVINRADQILLDSMLQTAPGPSCCDAEGNVGVWFGKSVSE